MFTEHYFYFFNNKNFFRLIWNVASCKNIFMLWYSYLITVVKFRIFIFIFLHKNQYMFDFTSTGFILFVLWHVLFYLLVISPNLSIYKFFDVKVIFIGFVFKVLINLSVTTDFPSLYVECISILLSCNLNFTDLLKNALPLSIHILFGLRLDSSKNV